MPSSVVTRLGLRMLDPQPPLVGWHAYCGDLFRRLCGRSASEVEIRTALEAARARASRERRGFAEGARDFAEGLRRA